MIDLKNYAPQSPEFKLPKNVSFPRVIFEGAKDMDEIRKTSVGKIYCRERNQCQSRPVSRQLRESIYPSQLFGVDGGRTAETRNAACRDRGAV